MAIYVLDLETRAKTKSMEEHAALEPWRVRQGHAEIMSCDIIDSEGNVIQIVNRDDTFISQLQTELRKLKGHIIYAHNALFDIAWLIASLQPQRCGVIPQEILDIDWRCTRLLFKWLINGQKAEESRFSLALANLVKTFLPNHPRTQEFLEMKAEGHIPGRDEEYWLARGTLDVIMTKALLDEYHSKVPSSMRIGLMTEFKCLVPVANSWITGFRIDKKQMSENEVHYAAIKKQAATELNKPETLFSSPKQLSQYLFTELGLTPVETTPTGSPSTSAGSLKWILYRLNEVQSPLASNVQKILDAKEAATNLSKYVKTMKEALAHTGDGYIYSSPMLFGTYTGRMTYSNTTTHKDPDSDIKTKFKTSIAMHQIPRKEKRIRKCLLPPEGYLLIELDAAGQESRLMAIKSDDETMIDIFANDLDFHSMTGANIIGQEYEAFVQSKKSEGEDGGFYTESRQRGKLTNLACNYRISGKALAKQAFEKYDVMIDVHTGNQLVKTFVTSYSGVSKYWNNVINESRDKGYTESFGGRRFKLCNWGGRDSWGTESSAIMHPIQGAGASMKEIAIPELFEKVPEAVFALDLHDALFMYVPADRVKELYDKSEHALNSIDYVKYWGFKPKIPLPFDGGYGQNFSEIK